MQWQLLSSSRGLIGPLDISSLPAVGLDSAVSLLVLYYLKYQNSVHPIPDLDDSDGNTRHAIPSPPACHCHPPLESPCCADCGPSRQPQDPPLPLASFWTTGHASSRAIRPGRCKLLIGSMAHHAWLCSSAAGHLLLRRRKPAEHTAEAMGAKGKACEYTSRELSQRSGPSAAP